MLWRHQKFHQIGFLGYILLIMECQKITRKPRRSARPHKSKPPFTVTEIRISKGNRGMTMKLSTIDCNTLSTPPPTYPENDPNNTAIDLPISTANPAIMSELRMAKVNNQKTSCPRAVVPKM